MGVTIKQWFWKVTTFIGYSDLTFQIDQGE